MCVYLALLSRVGEESGLEEVEAEDASKEDSRRVYGGNSLLNVLLFLYFICYFMHTYRCGARKRKRKEP